MLAIINIVFYTSSTAKAVPLPLKGKAIKGFSILMNDLYNSKLSVFSKQLRKNMTSEEKHLWYDFLKKLPFTVKRQKIIGDYIVDFYIASKNIVIEIDGLQHKTEEYKIKDRIRDQYLNKLGITVLRYTNIYLNRNFYSVCNDICKYLDVSVECILK